MSLIDKIDKSRVPTHVAIIMDGNGRWAKKQGELRIFGHQNGVTAVRASAEAAAKAGIKYLTLYAFSTENWNRPSEEVNALMELLVDSIKNEMKTLLDNNIRLKTIGHSKSLPPKCYNELMDAINQTSENKGLTLILALSYSSKWELIEATRKIGEMVKSNQIEPKDIDEKIIEANLCTHDFPDPELLIRTSGEHRISNFLLWQIAYAELYFTEVLWPDFSEEDLFAAIIEFQNRERRFGKTSEQLINQ